LLGHKLYISKNVTDHVKEYKCERCNLEFTNNAEGKLVRLNSTNKERNLTLSKMYLNKIRRRAKSIKTQNFSSL